jgi:hypothetical protein
MQENEGKTVDGGICLEEEATEEEDEENFRAAKVKIFKFNFLNTFCPPFPRYSTLNYWQIGAVRTRLA